MWWPARHALLVADPHWGRDACYRAGGLPLPEGMMADSLARLGALIGAWPTRHVYILGDLVHARPSAGVEVTEAVEAFRRREGVPMTLIEGNHDRHVRQLPASWRIDRVAAPLVLGRVILRHEPVRTEGYFTWSGHLHPTARVSVGRGHVRLPAFRMGDDLGVLPAFCKFTGGPAGAVEDAPESLVIVEGEVVALSTGWRSHSADRACADAVSPSVPPYAAIRLPEEIGGDMAKGGVPV